MPAFARSKRHLTPSEVAVGKQIAKLRIHIELVTGRLKEFQLLDHNYH